MLKVKIIKYVVTFSFILFGAIIFAENSLFPKTITDGFMTSAQTLSGAELFKANCARCHGDDAKGGKGPDLTSEKRQSKWKDSDEKLVNKITKGGFIMPKFGKKLKPEEIKAIADYVRSLKG
jgi:cytochrome c oxidase cbb3-type subunit 3